MRKTRITKILLLTFLLSSLLPAATRYKWIVVGSLHNFYHDTGNEIEHSVHAQQLWGFCWDAAYRDKDMQAARGLWIGATDFWDEARGSNYEYKIAHNGPRNVNDIEMREYMPKEIKMIARYDHPMVLVDGNEACDLINAANARNDDVDEVDPNIPADRIVFTEVNTSLGLTIKRTVYAISQQNYDRIHISEFEFENTGIYNADGDVFQQKLTDVYFHWQWRDAVCQQGSYEASSSTSRNWIWHAVRDIRWGYATMNDVIGTDQDNPLLASPRIDRTGQDILDDDGRPMRGYMAWLGYWSDFGYDNIGSPLMKGTTGSGFAVINDGRLGSPQYKGMVVIHADESPTKLGDDRSQPKSTGFINSNHQHTYTAGLDQYDRNMMRDKYIKFLAGGHKGNHAETVWQEYGSANGLHADAGSYTKANDAAGFSQMMSFGPYDFEKGEKIRIVFAECAAGLGHDDGYRVGQTWKKAKDGEAQEVVNPQNPSQTMTIDASNADEWKDRMVYSGRDSMANTFRAAIKLYNENFYDGIPEAPRPPEKVEIFSTEEGVKISWQATKAITHPNFEGFRIYRAYVEKDSTYRQVVDISVSQGDLDKYRVGSSGDEFEYVDTQPQRGQNYYYYIVSYDDGTQNQVKPNVPLESSKFFTRTNRAATVKSPPAPNEKLNISDYDLNDPADRKALFELLVRVVPNPINVRNEKIQFRGNVNKLLFAGVPEGCRIRVFTERGDFVTDIVESEAGYAWYLTTEWQQILVSGVYIAYFEMEEDFTNPKNGVHLKKGDNIIKKFIVIR